MPHLPTLKWERPRQPFEETCEGDLALCRAASTTSPRPLAPSGCSSPHVAPSRQASSVSPRLSGSPPCNDLTTVEEYLAARDSTGEAQRIRRSKAAFQAGLFKSRFVSNSMERQAMPFEDPSLRRGLNVSNVLKCWGKILGSSKGSDNTFSMSRPLESLDVFISHNWSTGRISKFLTLAYYFNFFPAAALCIVIDLICGTLTALGTVHAPVAGIDTADAQLTMETAMAEMQGVTWLCTLSTAIIFPLTLFFGHDIWRLVGIRGRTVFLDKACIHQTNPQIQRKGIEHLSAFLDSSREMLIVYTSCYLERLWTVYELASMLILQQTPRIAVVPTDVVMVFCTAWVLLFFFLVASFPLASCDLEVQFAGIGGIISFVTLPFILQLRRWARKKAMIHRQAQSFAIRDSVCSVEQDREVVYGNVSVLMRVFGFVPMDAHDKDALDAFDTLARQLVPLHFKNSWGRSGLPWRCGFGVSLVWIAVMVDVLSSTRFWRSSPSRMISYISIWAMVVVAFPLWIALVTWISSICVKLRGVRDRLFIVLAWALASCSGIGMYWSFNWLWVYTWHVQATALIMAPVCGVAVIVSIKIYTVEPVPTDQQVWVKNNCKYSEDA